MLVLIFIFKLCNYFILYKTGTFFTIIFFFYYFIGDHITITFTHMEIDPTEFTLVSGEPCSWDYVQVYEGEGMDGPSLGKWCDNKTPPSVTSTGSALTLHLYVRYEFIGQFAVTYSSLNTGTSNTSIKGALRKSPVILLPFLSLRRKLHVRARNDHLAAISEQLPPERGMRLDSEYLTRQQAHPRVPRVRRRVERKLRSGLPRDTGGQRNRKTH